MESYRKEADLIPKREQDVIVYREIVQRDSQILPDKDQVNVLTETIDEFARTSGVVVTKLGDLNLVNNPSQAISRVPVQINLSGSFDQFLKFLNLFETMDRIVNTRSFKIVANFRSNDDPSVPVSHSIALELETYVYTPGAGLAKPVEIANYERRKEDPVIQKLVRQQKAARVEKYQLKPRINRRDPFRDPRRSDLDGAGAGVSGEDYETQKTKVDQFKVRLQLLLEDVRLMQQYLAEKKYIQYVAMKEKVDADVRKMDGELREADPKISVAELHEMFQEEVVVPFTRVAQDVEKPNTPLIFTKKDAADFLDKQNAALDELKYEEAIKVARDFESLIAQPNRKLAEDAADQVAALRANAVAADKMLKFLALKVRVSGRIRRPEGSLVLIGGKTRRVGDFIDDQNRCKLAEILDDKLVFEFDGLPIDYSLAQK